MAMEINKDATIKDSTATMLGVNHIGLSVKSLEKTLAFYSQATNFELVSREKISGNDVDELFGKQGISLEVAVLKAPNMLLELTEFSNNHDAVVATTSATAAGMTHTCIQSPDDDSAWDRYIAAGGEALSRGAQPVDLGGYGVRYGYAYDPEGNMMELEVLSNKLLDMSGRKDWAYDVKMWMTQVALVTHDIGSLMAFYESVLGFQPNRVGEVRDNVRGDEILDIDNVHMKAGWFQVNDSANAAITMEFWQYVNPVTAKSKGRRDVTALGYSFSLEVGDIQQEYRRLTGLGLEFVSKPVKVGEYWQAYTHDLDGNVFSLRQVVNPDSALSVRHFE